MARFHLGSLSRGPADRTVRGLPQDHPHLIFDGAPGFSGAQPEAGLEGFIEFADGQAGHDVLPFEPLIANDGIAIKS
jgi:hypothetical protein